ncbi:MAG: hypothetical protein ACKO37_07640 [Vampirovibrionales bacterium]
MMLSQMFQWSQPLSNGGYSFGQASANTSGGFVPLYAANPYTGGQMLAGNVFGGNAFADTSVSTSAAWQNGFGGANFSPYANLGGCLGGYAGAGSVLSQCNDGIDVAQYNAFVQNTMGSLSQYMARDNSQEMAFALAYQQQALAYAQQFSGSWYEQGSWFYQQPCEPCPQPQPTPLPPPPIPVPPPPIPTPPPPKPTPTPAPTPNNPLNAAGICGDPEWWNYTKGEHGTFPINHGERKELLIDPSSSLQIAGVGVKGDLNGPGVGRYEFNNGGVITLANNDDSFVLADGSKGQRGDILVKQGNSYVRAGNLYGGNFAPVNANGLTVSTGQEIDGANNAMAKRIVIENGEYKIHMNVRIPNGCQTGYFDTTFVEKVATAAADATAGANGQMGSTTLGDILRYQPPA